MKKLLLTLLIALSLVLYGSAATADDGPKGKGLGQNSQATPQAFQKAFAAEEEELDQRVEEIARNRKMDPGKVYASLQKDNRLRELERSITDEKVYRFLLEQSTITES